MTIKQEKTSKSLKTPRPLKRLGVNLSPKKLSNSKTKLSKVTVMKQLSMIEMPSNSSPIPSKQNVHLHDDIDDIHDHKQTEMINMFNINSSLHDRNDPPDKI